MLAISISQRHVYWSFFRENSRFLSSTQFAPMLSCSVYKSKTALWKERKHGRTKQPYVSYAMEIGRSQEKETLKCCIKTLGIPYQIRRPGIICDIEKNHFSCSPDAVYIDKDGDLIGVEVKTPQHEVPLIPDEIKPDHLLQCFSSLHMTQAKEWILFYRAFITKEKSCFIIRPDQLIWQDLKQHANRFMESADVPGRKTKKDKAVADGIISRILVSSVSLVKLPK